METECRRIAAELADRAPARRQRRGGRQGAGPAAVAGRRPLHLPRLPRVRPGARGRRRRAARGARHRPGLLRYDQPRSGSLRPADGRGAGQGPRPAAADHHQGQLPLHGAPLGLPRLRRRQDVRRRGRRHGGAALPRPVHLRGLHRVGPAGAGASRRKVARVLERSGFTADSHSGKDLLRGAGDLPARRAVPDRRRRPATTSPPRCCTCRSGAGPGCSCARTSTAGSCPASSTSPATATPPPCGCEMESILRSAFDGASVDYTTRVSESVLARLHFVVRVGRRRPIPDVDEAELQRLLVDATRTWDEDLAEAARSEYGEEAGARLVGLYGKAFPEALQGGLHAPCRRGRPAPRRGARARRTRSGLNLYQEPGSAADERRFKLYRRGPLSLTAVLPLFTHLGVEVVDERPYEIEAIRRAERLHLRLRAQGARAGLDRPAATTACASCSRTRSRRCGTGAPRVDGFNALVLGAGLTWRQVVILRAVAKYLRQTGSTFSQEYVDRRAASPTCALAAALVELFEARFDPDRFDGARRGGAGGRAERARRADRPAAWTRWPASTTTGSSAPCSASSGPPCGRTTSSATPPGEAAPAQVLRQLQARPDGGARPAGAAADVRDLGLQPAGRGRAPALRQGRPRRPALERPA